MEEFLKLKWKIEGPHELDYGPEFIPEEEILKSFIYMKKDPEKLPEHKPIEPKTKVGARKEYTLKSPIKSFLNKSEHSQCLKALHMLQTGKKGLSISDKGCIELYNNVQQRITEENQKFLDFAKKSFLKKTVKGGFTKSIQNYAELILKKQLERCKSYPQHYKEIDTLLYSYKDDETPIEMVQLANLLELGTLAKFVRPTLLTPCHISWLPNIFETYYSNLPVSKDVNIKGLLENHECEIVISSSGLKKLLNFSEINCSWDIPVVIKEINLIKADGTCVKRNVVFLDIPLPKTKPAEINIMEKAFKLCLKSHFCIMEALKYAGVEEVLNIEKSGDDVNNPRKVYHNVSYRMWHLRQEEKQSELMKSQYKTKNVKVLVRCKLDACEAIENSMLQPLTLYPKLEHQPEFGGAIPSKTELINQWASIFFRPYSQVCRFRIACASKEVLMLENCNIQKINNELHTHYGYKPSLGLGVLYKLFLDLKTLPPGNYLLQHLPKHGSFVSLLQSCNEGGSYDLYEHYNIKNWTITKKYNEWCPIDCNLILPKHLTSELMPGLFPPSLKPKTSSFKANKYKNKKPKNKTKKYTGLTNKLA